MFRKKKIVKTYDKANYQPVIRASICTGEQVIGFKNIHTKEFIEYQLITSPKDLKHFLEEYQISIEEVKKEY